MMAWTSRDFLFQYVLSSNTTDIIQPDVGYSGGFTSVLRIAQQAQAAGKRIDLHSPNSSLNIVMTMVR